MLMQIRGKGDRNIIGSVHCSHQKKKKPHKNLKNCPGKLRLRAGIIQTTCLFKF